MTVEQGSDSGDEIEDFEDLDDLDDFEGYEDLVEALGLPERLPPVWLPPLSELAAAARESLLLKRVGELVAWVGERRELTEEGDLVEADAAQAAEMLGVSATELLVCWETAIATDLVMPSEDGTADANPDLWPTGDDEEDIGTWAFGFTQVLQSLAIEAELAGEQLLTFEGAGALVLPLFLAREHGEQIDELRQMAHEMETEDLPDDSAWHAWVAEHGDPVTTLLARLVEHGAVEVDETTVRLTPLGMLVMREELVDGGVDVPLLPPPAEMTAADLLTVVGGRTGEELTELADTWLDGRDKPAAELLAAAAEADPAGRYYAWSILGRLQDVPWPTVLDDPALRPYAKSALGEDLDPADAAWRMLDAITASANILGELNPAAVEIVCAEVLPAGREEETLTDAWRLPHPAVFEVLTLVGGHHPDKKLAKVARTAAHKAQSAG
ncbi:hypothetical protein [Actinophytocola oryzae]|uniref:Uncharacterized protein n=1 Tax=Actinophytocola oryzae TaxID=502181 RepID=A0A4R7UT57_9PSEU|nr:hypothetical protein [Actinophytocola oryzae]TDV39789.1 hypothetical protein CLV71_125101 [Actinophytocola oryzae]